MFSISIIMMKNKKQGIDKFVLITAMICITAMQIFALSKGHNGYILSTVIGVIALIAGVAIPKEKFIKS